MPDHLNSDYAVMVLCAGYGTRLQALSHDLPKPLMPFFGSPILEHIIRDLRDSGFQSIAINTHHKASAFDALVASFGLHTSNEKTLLGSGGGIAAIMPWIGKRSLIVLNGDVLAHVAWFDLIRRHENSGAHATLGILPQPLPGENAVVCQDNRVLGFEPRISVNESLPNIFKRGFACVQVLRREFLDLFAKVEPFSVLEIYEQALKLGQKVYADLLADFWTELGCPNRFLSSHLKYLSILDSGQDPLAITNRGSDLLFFNSGLHRHEGTYVRGPTVLSKQVTIQPNTTIGPYTALIGPCLIKERSRLEESLIFGGVIEEAEMLRQVIQMGCHRVQGQIVPI